MATYSPPKRNTAFICYVGLVSQADGAVLQANPTLAAGDVKIAKDDGAPANLATLPAVDADFTKRVKVSLSATEMDADQVTILFADAAGAEWSDLMLNIQTVARQNDDLAYPATSGRSLDVDASGRVVLQAVTHTGAVIPTVSALTGHTAQTGDAFARLGAPAGASVSADIAAIEAQTDDIGAAGAGLTALATAAALATVNTVVDAIQAKTDALPSDPADQSLIIAATNAVIADTEDIQARLPAALDTGRMVAVAEVVGDKTGYALTVGEHASVADKLLGRARAGGADGGRTVAECLALGRNKWGIVGTTLTVYADDDATPLYTAEVTQAAGDPITSVSPA